MVQLSGEEARDLLEGIAIEMLTVEIVEIGSQGR